MFKTVACSGESSTVGPVGAEAGPDTDVGFTKLVFPFDIAKAGCAARGSLPRPFTRNMFMKKCRYDPTESALDGGLLSHSSASDLEVKHLCSAPG